MTRPKHYTPDAAHTFAVSLRNLYTELEIKFGSDFAREFIINFYRGAGKGE